MRQKKKFKANNVSMEIDGRKDLIINRIHYDVNNNLYKTDCNEELMK